MDVNRSWSRGHMYLKIESRYLLQPLTIQHFSDAKARSIVSSLVVALCFSLLILSLWSMGQQQVANTIVGFDLRQTVLRKTSQRFLSYGLDSSLLRDMKNLPVNDKRFIDLARHLSPAYVRVGGTSADCLFFDQVFSWNFTINWIIFLCYMRKYRPIFRCHSMKIRPWISFLSSNLMLSFQQQLLSFFFFYFS